MSQLPLVRCRNASCLLVPVPGTHFVSCQLCPWDDLTWVSSR